MRVEEARYSIAEIVDWYRQRQLVVNREYQRGGGLWPSSAKSYFIDTILKEFPFPKLYFHEILDPITRRPRREIVDGQQRIATIVDFADGRLSLGSNALGMQGQSFEDLSPDQQNAFYSYVVAVDVIRNADRANILQMFRRMNAFTLPLNAPEKRHSEFFGDFKNWINTLLDRFGSVLVEWEILSSRQMVRMMDAEFMADIVLAIEEGVVSTSPTKLRNLYKKHDATFPMQNQLDEQISDTFVAIMENFSELQGTYILRLHVFHSLICAMLYNKYELVTTPDLLGEPSIGEYFIDRETALDSLKRLGAAHEEKDFSEFGEYVQAASEGGNRAPQRLTRIKWLVLALQGRI